MVASKELDTPLAVNVSPTVAPCSGAVTLTSASVLIGSAAVKPSSEAMLKIWVAAPEESVNVIGSRDWSTPCAV